MKRSASDLTWQEILWSRPFGQNDVMELLTHLATLSPRKNVVWEIRGSGGKVRYFIATGRRYLKPLKAAIMAHGDITFADAPLAERKAVTVAKQVKRTKSVLSLKTENTLLVLKTALAALANTKDDETLVMQIALGESYSPSPAPDKAIDPHATLFDKMCGNIGTASKESLSSIKVKHSQHGFHSLIRIGADAENRNRAGMLLLSLMSALRQYETSGVKLIFSESEPTQFNEAKIPWFLPLRLSIAELAGFTLLPCTDAILFGVEGLHPKLLRPPEWFEDSSKRSFAKSLGAGSVDLHIPIKDSLEHTIILGATGSGKSSVMLSLILQDIKNGLGTLVIDPKADLINDILSRVPENRIEDIVVIDPSDITPVGINPFQFSAEASPSLIADTILAVFKQIFSDSWGVYSQDVLSAALLTLAQTPNATLLSLPALLSDEGFRRRITSKIKDKHGLEPFWEAFETMSHSEKRRTIAPVMNKLRQFTMRPALRNMLGQVKPKFNLSDIFDKNKIILLQLNKGIIGAEAAKLLGSMVVGLTWSLALSRANIPKEERNPVSVYIDELQDFIHGISNDFESSLAQARGLGLGFTLAHQYRAQLPPEIKAAIDTNARNKIIFGLNSSDAKEMAAMSPELEAVDFQTLPRYHIYAQMQNNGKNTGWISGQTLPPPDEVSTPFELKAASMERYGGVAEEPKHIAPAEALSSLSPIGRKKVS